MAQIYSGMSTVDVAYSLPDLGSALKDIQAQYDSIAAKNLQVVCSHHAEACVQGIMKLLEMTITV